MRRALERTFPYLLELQPAPAHAAWKSAMKKVACKSQTSFRADNNTCDSIKSKSRTKLTGF
jgi:hypothetical protein